MWLQKNNRNGKYYWYGYLEKGVHPYLGKATWLEVILNKLFKCCPKNISIIRR